MCDKIWKTPKVRLSLPMRLVSILSLIAFQRIWRDETWLRADYIVQTQPQTFVHVFLFRVFLFSYILSPIQKRCWCIKFSHGRFSFTRRTLTHKIWLECCRKCDILTLFIAKHRTILIENDRNFKARLYSKTKWRRREKSWVLTW